MPKSYGAPCRALVETMVSTPSTNPITSRPSKVRKAMEMILTDGPFLKCNMNRTREIMTNKQMTSKQSSNDMPTIMKGKLAPNPDLPIAPSGGFQNLHSLNLANGLALPEKW